VADVIMVGTGGQGIILAAQIAAEVAVRMGFDVKTSEVHGMAQRGGSVSSMVRWSEKVYSPLIPRGHADILLAFEGLEALRNLGFLKPDGRIILNRYRLDPLPVLRGDAIYPEDFEETIRGFAPDSVVLDAASLAREAGNVRVVSAVMVGALSALLDFPMDVWEEVVRSLVPAKAVEANLKGFMAGRGAV
jgi:indolepyruvate ferredoxin oxidoreductase beta subunit